MATRQEYKLGIDVISPAPSGTGGDLIQDNFKTIADLIEGQNTAIADKASASHTHSTSNITGLDTALNGKAAASHTHSISNITGLDTALSGKAPASHSHSYNDLSDKPTIPAAYTLPTASTSELGGVKVDGSTITINNNGVISANGGGGSGSSTLAGLSDVGISNPQTGQVLTFTGSAWQNSTSQAGDADTILNRNNCYQNGLYSLAVGQYTSASGDKSFVFGHGSGTYGNYSLAGGVSCDTTQGADGSFTMGESSSNRSKNSLLIGDSCINFGANSISTGYVNYNTFENAVTANGLIEGYYPWDLYHNKYGSAGFMAFRSNTIPFKLLAIAPTDILIARIDILYFARGVFTTKAVSFKVMIIEQEIKACEIFKPAEDSFSSESDIYIENGALMYQPEHVFSSSPDFQVGIFFTRYSNSRGSGSSSSSSSSAY